VGNLDANGIQRVRNRDRGEVKKTMENKRKQYTLKMVKKDSGWLCDWYHYGRCVVSVWTAGTKSEAKREADLTLQNHIAYSAMS